jgi:hypothetical protein
MLPCDNTSFVGSVDQIKCVIVTNDNTYMVSQRMKSYFVNLIFHLKIHVIYYYDHTSC